MQVFYVETETGLNQNRNPEYNSRQEQIYQSDPTGPRLYVGRIDWRALRMKWAADEGLRAESLINLSWWLEVKRMLALLIVLVPTMFNLSAAQGRTVKTSSTLSPPGCAIGDCGLHSSSAYPELVIGLLQHVYDENEMRELYRWGKSSDVWRDFDDDLIDFLARNRVLRISVGEARVPFILIVSRAEYDGAPPLAGDLVRYVPLRPHHDAEGRKAPSRFSVLAGCVAILCRQTDGSCFKNYEEGFFNKTTGAEISRDTGKAVPAGKVVDPITAWPLK